MISSRSPKHTTSEPTTQAIFRQLLGAWRLQRILGQAGTMEGIAHFEYYAPGIWYYREQGNVTLSDTPASIVARNDYAYVYDQDTLSVHFWEQEPARRLHTLNFKPQTPPRLTQEATGVHRCKGDTYKAHYIFLTDQLFRLTYHIQGPRKDYKIWTQYAKL